MARKKSATKKTGKHPVKKKKARRQSSVNKSPKTSLYAGLYDKDTVRKSLLEAMKETIILLQRYQKIAIMREQRMILEEQMKRILSGISENLSDFRSTLPILPKVEKPKIKPVKKKPVIKADLKEIDKLLEMPIKHRPAISDLGSEFDNLGKRLEDIDKKLRELENL